MVNAETIDWRFDHGVWASGPGKTNTGRKTWSIYNAPVRTARRAFFSARRVGGITFIRIGRINATWSVSKKKT